MLSDLVRARDPDGRSQTDREIASMVLQILVVSNDTDDTIMRYLDRHTDKDGFSPSI